MVATGHMWVFKFNFNEIKLEIYFLGHITHISSAPWTHVAI